MTEYYGGYGRGEKPRRTWFGRLFDSMMSVLTLLVAVALVLTYIAPYVNPASVWVFSILGLAAPATYLAAVLLTLYWVVRWRWGRAGLMLALVCVGFFKVSLFYKPVVKRVYEETAPTERGAVKFLTYNVRNFYSETGGSAADSVLRYVAGLNPDIVCLQEFNPALAEASGTYETFLEVYPYVAGGNGSLRTAPLVIFSRYPLVRWGATKEEPLSDNVSASIWADLRLGDDTIRIFNNHLHSTAIKADDNEYITKHRYISDTAREVKIRSIVRRFRDNSILRAQQVDSIALAIRSTPYALIVCGDFNDTPMSYVYRTMSRGLTDAFRCCGRGYSYTYRGFFNTLRIDYVLSSSAFEPFYYEVPYVDYSDHLPVVVYLHYLPRY